MAYVATTNIEDVALRLHTLRFLEMVNVAGQLSEMAADRPGFNMNDINHVSALLADWASAIVEEYENRKADAA